MVGSAFQQLPQGDKRKNSLFKWIKSDLEIILIKLDQIIELINSDQGMVLIKSNQDI